MVVVVVVGLLGGERKREGRKRKRENARLYCFTADGSRFQLVAKVNSLAGFSFS